MLPKEPSAEQQLADENDQKHRPPIQMSANQGQEDRPGRPVGEQNLKVDPVEDGDNEESQVQRQCLTHPRWLTQQQRMALYRLLYMYGGLYGPLYGLSPSEFAVYLLLAAGGRGGASGFPPTRTGLGGIGGPLPFGPLLTTTPGPCNPGYP